MSLRLFANYYKEDEVLSNKDRMYTYKKHQKDRLSDEELNKIHKKTIGEFRGLTFYIVDGNYLRGNVDLDFVLGGNGGRYKYVPEDEIWCGDVSKPEDLYAVFAHEYIEMVDMIHGKRNYDKAHDFANEYEIYIRRHHNLSTFEEFTKAMEEFVDEDNNISPPPKHEEEPEKVKESDWAIRVKGATIPGSVS